MAHKTSAAASESLFVAKKDDDRSGHPHRLLIGTVALFLAPALWLYAGLRPIEELARWNALDSVSAYYYTSAVAIFVGALVALAALLITYKGYRTLQRFERWTAVVAGLAALGVAGFPTEAPVAALRPDWWTRLDGVVHFASAAILFLALICFAILFTRTREGRYDFFSGRNRVYSLCALGMAACLAWAASSIVTKAAIFVPEFLALVLFGICWLAKGRVEHTVWAGAKRYARQPGRVVTDLRGVIERE